MALTRSMLKGMGLTEEQVGAIIEEHGNTVSGLKAEIEKYRADAEKLGSVQKELNELKSGDADWKGKFEKERKAFEDGLSSIVCDQSFQFAKTAAFERGVK